MTPNSQELISDEQQRAARVELALFAFSRLVLFLSVVAGTGWVLRSILEYLLLNIERLIKI